MSGIYVVLKYILRAGKPPKAEECFESEKKFKTYWQCNMTERVAMEDHSKMLGFSRKSFDKFRAHSSPNFGVLHDL